jgi:hypothetical protein
LTSTSRRSSCISQSASASLSRFSSSNRFSRASFILFSSSSRCSFSKAYCCCHLSENSKLGAAKRGMAHSSSSLLILFRPCCNASFKQVLCSGVYFVRRTPQDWKVYFRVDPCYLRWKPSPWNWTMHSCRSATAWRRGGVWRAAASRLRRRRPSPRDAPFLDFDPSLRRHSSFGSALVPVECPECSSNILP